MADVGSAFANKVVLVVGASSGIGREFAVKAAKLGATVAVTARRQAELDALRDEIGGQCLAVASDSLDEASAKNAVDETVRQFGRLDIALLNVGGAPAIDLRTQSAADIKNYMRVNYDVTVNSLVPCLDAMSAQGNGLIAVTNSLAGFIGLPLQGPYSAAKGALRLLIDTYRLEYSNRGISFVSLYPGFVATERTVDDGMPNDAEISVERAVDEMLQAIANGKKDALFPKRTAIQVQLGMRAPARLRDAILKSRVAPDPGRATPDPTAQSRSRSTTRP